PTAPRTISPTTTTIKATTTTTRARTTTVTMPVQVPAASEAEVPVATMMVATMMVAAMTAVVVAATTEPRLSIFDSKGAPSGAPFASALPGAGCSYDRGAINSRSSFFTELTRLLEHGDLALAAPVQATHRHDVRGRNVVARLQVERALPRIGQSVEVVDLLPG